MRSQSCKEQVMKTRRSKLVRFPVTAEGIIDLPDGAVIVSLDFEDERGMGFGRRPAAVWAEVPIENYPDA
jgi:hypothetical protein